MENLENLFQYTSEQFDIVRHVLTFGAAAQAVGLVYFLTNSSKSSPQFRDASTISAVVMVSAFLTLANQYIHWETSFTYTGEFWVSSTSTFSNGYRYVNWMIDVPMLLTQLLIVLGLRGRRFRQTWGKLVVAGLLMIWLGYIGQFYESTNITNLYIWGSLSTIFMVYILYVLGNLLFRSSVTLDIPDRARYLLRLTFWLTLASWTLYPLAYIMADWYPTAWGMVLRQTLYTVADISSKVIYGVILSQICQLRSRQLEHQEAIQAPVV
jgi:bacteriorhodopsin